MPCPEHNSVIEDISFSSSSKIYQGSRQDETICSIQSNVSPCRKNIFAGYCAFNIIMLSFCVMDYECIYAPCINTGVVGCIFIHLFVYLLEQQSESFCFATTLLHHAPPKVTSVLVLFFIFGRFILIDWYIVGLHKLYLAISMVFPIAVISICCVMFTANDSEVVGCGHELTLLLSSFSFWLTWMSLQQKTTNCT